MAPTKKDKKTGLGRAIINRRQADAHRPRDNQLYTTDHDQRLQSVTQERDLDEFLNTAQLAGTDFTAEKQNVTIVQAPGVRSAVHNQFLLSEEEEQSALRKHEQHKSALRVPRRPPWKKSMTAQQLDRQERDAFLDWRRNLAQVQERDDLVFTPFERNIERSHLIVQIVDARNPLRFRCEDLEGYVKDIEGSEGEAGTGTNKRKSLLLINKSDLLSVQQRVQWADYFDSQNVAYAFYSAANANAIREARELAVGAPSEPHPVDPSSVEESTPEAATPKSASVDEEGSNDQDDEEDDEDDEDEDEEESESETGHFLPIEEAADPQTADPRTRVLSVQELESLFLSAAPPLTEFTDPSGGVPTKTVVGLVGYPNVGKSSTINSLVGEKKVSVSSTPGKTKHFQTIQLSDGMVLCDCPGLVFPQFATTKAELVCDGVLPIDQLREHSAPVTLVTRRVPRPILELTYGLTLAKRIEDDDLNKDFISGEDLLIAYAVARGFARSGQGNPDEARASRYVLKDYVNAKLLYCNPPPNVNGDDFNAQSRVAILDLLQRSSKKKAPQTRVGKGADTYIPPDLDAAQALPQARKAKAIDQDFFQSASSLSSRPFVQSGSIRHGQEFSRARLYPHQNAVADNGTPVDARKARIASVLQQAGGAPSEHSKKHGKANKRKKQRSGAGYD
ncbi:P-loop containing nucleoside triphosphate hydrolase protein [Auriculariales sp. MPI-PUGE-AT-0066]|nr:P-loop containing nucleoside triphosphate hydrolase protein [Auriculariales sp. MPI-PUGE-AT-0066]